MKITRSWLEDYLDISVKTEELCHELTMAGLEVDEIIKIDNDDLIDIDLTPNRSDCLSVFGVSRELNIINKKYKMKPTKNKIATNKFRFLLNIITHSINYKIYDYICSPP